MKVKEISRTANVAWSPSALQCIHLACGTVAQQLDATFRSAAATRTAYVCLGLQTLQQKQDQFFGKGEEGRGWLDNQILCETGCVESMLVWKRSDAYKYKQLQKCSLQQYQVFVGVKCA